MISSVPGKSKGVLDDVIVQLAQVFQFRNEKGDQGHFLTFAFMREPARMYLPYLFYKMRYNFENFIKCQLFFSCYSKKLICYHQSRKIYHCNVYCYIFLLFVFLISKTILLIFPGFESWLLLEFFSFFLFHTADPNFCPFFCQKHLKLSLAFIKQSFCHCFSSWITIDSWIQIT